MQKRKKLQKILEDILESKNVYFQPPENLKIKYPCFIYNANRRNDLFADNKRYIKGESYEVTFISHDLDTIYEDRLMDKDYVFFSRFFVSDNLYHTVYIVYI